MYYGPEDVRYETVPDVEPGKEEVKLRVTACGICGSDVRAFNKETVRRKPPMVMGHEFAGEVVQLGPGADRLKVGDRVALFPFYFCGECERCRQKEYQLCENKRAYGIIDVNGAMADYICVSERSCFVLEETVSDAVGSLMEPLSIGCHAVGRVGNLEGKTVLIIGAGTIGLLTVALVKLQNPARIIVSSRTPSKLDIARKMGADEACTPEELPDALKRHTGGKGVNFAFDAVGYPHTLSQAIESLAFGGEAVAIGGNVTELNVPRMLNRELTLKGTFLCTYDEYQTCAGLLNAGKVQADPLISAYVPLSEGPKYFETLANNPGDLIKVVLHSDERGV